MCDLIEQLTDKWHFKRRDNVVVVQPMYVLIIILDMYSPSEQANPWITLVSCRPDFFCCYVGNDPIEDFRVSE